MQLESGKEYIVSVVGDQFGEEEIVEALQRCDLNAQIALNELLMQKTLKSPTAPPPTSTRGFPSFAPHASQITDQGESILCTYNSCNVHPIINFPTFSNQI